MRNRRSQEPGNAVGGATHLVDRNGTASEISIMPEQSYSYVIVGAGLAGASAVEGIRQVDERGSILLLGAEKDLPYDRPPLSKQLWTGGKSVAEIVLHDEAFYEQSKADLRL